ncbi:g4938 [Coccomyxa viridis]|uniref:G4938 protein n=1 Tax=Coccomyxa viridis TaxID=1274662 RepID=A0ABP1FYF1_9CHLO
MGRPLYTWTPDLKTIIEFAAKEGTRIFFHTTRDPSNAVTLPTNLLEFGEGILPHDNAHFAAVPADAAAIHDLVLSWLWPLWTPPPTPLQLYFQPVIGQGTALACRAAATLQPIIWAYQAALTCACHGLPTSACSAGRAMLAAECTTDSSYARVSDTCLLRLSKDAPKLPGCAAMPDMRFTVLRRAKVADLHEPLLHGVSHALLPEHADGLPEESLLSGLAEVLYDADEALIARALFDLDTRLPTSVPVFYALLPAVNGASAWLLARRVACEEEMLAGPLHADGSPGRATEAAKEAAGKLLERIKCPAFSPLDLRNGFPSTIKRLLDASVPLPQELIQAQKGLAKQAQRTPLPLRPREDAAAADQENSGAGQAGRGPAKAVKTRHRMAMQDSGRSGSAGAAAPSGRAPKPGPRARRAQPTSPKRKGTARFQQLDINAHSGAGDQDAKKKKLYLPSMK